MPAGAARAASRNSAQSAGGVRVVKSVEDVVKNAPKMLGNTLVTKQTGPAGKQVNRLYIEDGCRHCARALPVDAGGSHRRQVAFVVSTEGGMDIEAVAEETPEKIINVAIDPIAGITDADDASLCDWLNWKARARRWPDTVSDLYKAFTETDMSLLEINPLVVLGNGHLRVLTPRSRSTATRCSAIPTCRASRRDRRRRQGDRGLQIRSAYIALDGDIGCMVNGAGLAMATMDIIKLYGADLPTSSMLAAAPPRKRSPRPSRSSRPIRT